jgi:hypothetical protein
LRPPAEPLSRPPGVETALLTGAGTAVFTPKPVKNERFLKIFQKNEVFSLFFASK